MPTVNEQLSMEEDKLVSIVIVNYETSAYVKRCVASLRAQDYPWEAFIVDNPSPENDFENLPDEPQVQVVRSQENVGYGPGCNLGAERVSTNSEYICILNPDTAVPDGELRRWVASHQLHCPNGGVVGPALHNDNGAVQKSHYRFFNAGNYWLTHSLLAGFLINVKKGSWTGGRGRGFSDAQTPQGLSKTNAASANLSAKDTDWLMGAALLIDRSTWKKLNGFSDQYFLYSEDTDLCWRCGQMSLPVIYDPTVHIWHSQGDPAAGARETGIVRLFDGMKRFVDLNYTGLRKSSMYGVVITDMLLRLAILSPLQLFRRNNTLLQSRLRGYKRVLSQWGGQE